MEFHTNFPDVSAVFTRPGAGSSLRGRIATTITAVRTPPPHTDTGCARYRLSASRCRAPPRSVSRRASTDRSNTRLETRHWRRVTAFCRWPTAARLDNSLEKV